MRLFITIEPPQKVIIKLKRLQEKLLFKGVKTTKELHLTLLFLGEKTERQTQDIIKKLSRISINKFELTTNYIGAFPNNKNPRVLWVGIKESEQLQNLGREIHSQLGVAFESYKTHITLARIKYGSDPVQIQKFLINTTPLEITFKIKEFKLIQSTLTEKGSIYHELQRFPLKKFNNFIYVSTLPI